LPLTMKIIIAIAVFLFFILVFSGCSEDPVQQPPEISFFRVINSGTLYALDTLKFDLVVQSEYPVSSLKMSLKSNEGTVLLSHVWNQENSHEITLYDEAFLLSRKDLETGTYMLEAYVYAENGTAKDIRDVPLVALAPEVERVMLVCHNNELTTTIGVIDSDLSFSEMFSLNGDFLDAYADSDDEFLYTVGSMSGNLICTSLKTFEEVWQYGVDTNPPFPKFRAALLSEDHIWVSIHPDYILGFDKIGVEKFRANLSTERYPESMIIDDNLVVVEEFSKATAKKSLSRWWRVSGALMESHETFADDLILMGFHDNELYYAEVNDAISSIYAIDLYYNSRRWLFDYQGVFKMSCRGSNGTYFLTSGPDLYVYSPDYSVEFRHTFHQPVESMTYDNLNAILYVIAGNAVFKYSTAQNIVEKTNTFDASPDKVVIQYNRNLFTSEMY